MSVLLEDVGKFKTVVIDPPWPVQRIGYSDKKRCGYEGRPPYDLMSLDDIFKLPIEHCLDDNAVVFCWTINRFLPISFDLLDKWKSPYSFTMTWIKTNGIQLPDGPRFNAEWIIVGKRGSPKWKETKAFQTANLWKRRAHSEKPEEFYDLLRRITEGPRLDIFGRRNIPGFQSWGNEAPQGEPAPSIYQGVMF